MNASSYVCEQSAYPSHALALSKNQCEQRLEQLKGKRTQLATHERVILKERVKMLNAERKAAEKAERDMKKLQKQKMKTIHRKFVKIHTENLKEVNNIHKSALKTHSKEMDSCYNVVLPKLEAFYDRVNGLAKTSNPKKIERLKKRHGRSYGNDIHDIPMEHTGYVSKKLLAKMDMFENGMLTKKPVVCKEHFHPRQWVGELMIEKFVTGEISSFEEFVKFVYQYVKVHHVTSDENRDLMKFQDAEEFIDWRDTYEQANIELVKVSNSKRHDGWKMLIRNIENGVNMYSDE